MEEYTKLFTTTLNARVISSNQCVWAALLKATNEKVSFLRSSFNTSFAQDCFSDCYIKLEELIWEIHGIIKEVNDIDIFIDLVMKIRAKVLSSGSNIKYYL